MNVSIYRIHRTLCRDRFVRLLALTLICLHLTSTAALTDIRGIEKSDYFGTYEHFAPGIYGGTLPRVELLAGVLSHTSWMERRGPVGSGNKYFRELHAFFDPFKDHAAIKIAEQLTTMGFTYDAPPNFILSLSALPELEAENGYSDYLLRRARGKKRLENFRVALSQLSAESGFMVFYRNHASDYRDWVSASTVDFNAEKLTDWLEDFFGWSGEEFHLVFAPAMFRGGGYGANYTIDNRFIAYQVIRERGASTDLPDFGGSVNVEHLSLHELGHAFVNPSLKAHRELIDDLRLVDFYRKVEKQMKEQAYGTLSTFLNESVLRAVTALGYGDFAGNNEVEYHWSRREKARGFLLQDVIVESLMKYRSNRTEYPSFRDYVPALLKDINAARSELL